MGATTRRFLLDPIGIIRSNLKTRAEAPKQGSEGAPDAWLELSPAWTRGLHGLAVGDRLILLTWLHRARRDVLAVRPRGTSAAGSPVSSRPARRTDQTRWAFTT